MTLYELTNDYMAVLEMMEDPDADPQVIADTLEGIGGAIEDKADNYAKIMAELTGKIDALEAEANRLSARAAMLKGNKQRMKERLQNAMVASGKTKFKTDLFSFNIQKNPPSVEVQDESLIPKGYFIQQEPRLDKKRILEMLKDGKKVKGCTLRQSSSLRIR